MSRAVVFGCAGPELGADEGRFFAESDPWGFILFRRNIESPDQVRALVEDLRDAVGRPAPVFCDQEGGRVARLRQPHWQEWPAVGVDVERAGGNEDLLHEMLWLRYRLIAADLQALGIDVNCAPVLDVPAGRADPVIGDRALGADPALVAARGRVVCEALLAGGVLPVIKHMPGHGRADVDSHFALPVVGAPRSELAASDFLPFAGLSDMPLAMTAHVAYSDIDGDCPATLSGAVMEDVIRREIGFDGVLVTDDLDMKALPGTPASRARAALAAGCDILLQCNGDLGEMQQTAEAAVVLAGRSAERVKAAEAARQKPLAWDAKAARRRLEMLAKECCDE